MTTSDEALAVFREADLTDNQIHELIGRLTVIAPDALIQAIHHLKEDRKR